MRRGLATLLLLGLALAGLALATDADVPLWRAGPVQAVLYAAALGLAGRAAFGRAHPLMFVALLAGLLLVPFATLLRMQGYVDFTALLYHMQAGVTALSLSVARNPFVVACWAALTVLLAAHHLGHLWHRPGLSALVATMALVVANPLPRAALAAFGVASDPRHLAGRIAAPPVPGAAMAADPSAPHVVLIYLEGLERAYADRARFGEAYAPLEDLAREGIELTGIGQVEGTGWSAAGMVASQCGLPLLPHGGSFANMLIAEPALLPAQACLGDLLAARGYEGSLVLGGEAIFGGIGAFYRGHGVPGIVELADLRAALPPDEAEAAFAGWVMDDQAVFEAARDRFARGVAGGRPQFLVVETFGPHGPEQMLSRRCTASGHAEVGSDIAAAAACLTTQAAAFVREARALGAGRGVLVAVLSDHLGHDRRLRRDEAARRDTAILLGAGVEVPQVIAKRGAVIDLYPTLLALLGIGRPDGRAGLGVSLLGAAPTLMEELGPERLDAQLRFDPEIRAAVWDGAGEDAR